MDVSDILRKEEAEKKETAIIFNPLKTDFTAKYDGIEYTIISKDLKRFPKQIARHVGKHLAIAYKNTKDKNYPIEKARKLVFNE